ncbi:MAG: NUDIX domain-containing protein [Candidatus ainarchaeum sp.]|nr:NUDIX domain-containing protein [Candidatus ainarchaeum sp.]
MLIPIVNEKDKIICYKDRDSIGQKDIYRVSALWIINSKSEFLLAKRVKTKKNNPGKWGPAVAGTVEKGETYKQNILKETKEELGLDPKGLRQGPKIKNTGEHNFFCQWYFLKQDKDEKEFDFDKKEVDEVKWFSKKEFEKEYLKNPELFLKNAPFWVNTF